MAEVTAMRNNATIFPVYGLPYTVVIPILDADGDPVTGATGLDSEASLNGDTPADCTNEATEIGTSGCYYLTLTAAEMTADIISGVTKTSTSGAKTTPWVLYPRKLPILLTSDNAGDYDSTTTINLGSSASAIDDFYNGCLVYIYGGTGSGQVRMITDYVGSTKLATVHVAWATNPDATSDLKIYRTEQAPYAMGANVTHISGTAQTARDIGASVLLSAGTGTGQLDFTSGVVKANLAQILGTALTETAGQIAAAFKKFFDKATPTGTINSLPDAVPGANGGLLTTNGTKVNQTVDLTAGQTIPTVTNLTNLPVVPTDWLTAAGVKADAVTKIQAGLATPTNITAGTITTVTNLTNAPTAGDLTATMKTSITTAATAATPALSAAGVAAIWAALTSGLTTAGSIGKKLADWVVGTIDTYTGNTKQTGDTYARLGAPAGASVSADVAAIKTETAAILVDTGTTLDAKINTIDDFLDTEIAAILADTNELQTDLVNGGRLDLLIDAIKAKTDNLPATPAAVGSAMTLTAAYDAAKTAATQTSVNTIDDFLDTEIAAILADTNELQTDLVNGGRLDLLIDAIKAKTDNLPADPADQSAVEAAITAATSPLATSAALDAVDNYVDTEIAAIKAVTDKLDTAVELDGAVYRLTENALEQAPTGGTAPTVEQIRAEIDANSTQLAAIVADTNELQTDLTNGGRVDLLIDGIKAKTDKMTYTSGNDLDVNVQKINDVTLTGNGSTTPIGAA